MIFVVATLAFLLLAIHPFVTYPLSLILAPRRPLSRLELAFSSRPAVSICMSAFNEERVIVAKVESLLAMAQMYGPADIHIYVDGSTDRTAELLAPYADRVDLVVSAERRGKTVGLERLVDRSRGVLLAFTDANVLTPRDGLVKLAEAFTDASVGCVTAKLRYSNADETGMSFAGALYWRIEEAIKRLETETVGVIGVDGAFFMIARDAYSAPPVDLIDDLYVSLSALAQGRRVVSSDVEVFERNATQAGEEFRRKARISCQAMNVHRALWPRLSRMPPLALYAYISHRLLKWLMPFNLMLAALCAFAILVERFGLVAGLLGCFSGLALLAFAAMAGLKLGRLILSMVASLAGVGYGVLQSLLGHRNYTVWNPAASIRA